MSSTTHARPDGTARDGGPALVAAFPQIFVTAMESAIRFYRDQLGFRVAYLYGEPPFYGLVERGGAALNLRHVDRLPIDAARRDADELLAASIPVHGVGRLHAEFAARGVSFARGPTRQPWGAEDFVVRDPDGNLICFSGGAP